MSETSNSAYLSTVEIKLLPCGRTVFPSPWSVFHPEEPISAAIVSLPRLKLSDSVSRREVQSLSTEPSGRKETVLLEAKNVQSDAVWVSSGDIVHECVM